MSNRILKAGWINFKRNSYLSAAAIGIMSLALALFFGLIAFQFLTSRIVTTFEGKVDITAYYKAGTQEADILDVKSDIEKLPIVAEVTYTSREQALIDFRENRKKDTTSLDALDQLDDNPFFASLNILATDPSNYEEIDRFLNQDKYQPILRKVDLFENKDVIDKVRNISSAMKNWGFITTIVIAVIAVLVSFNTVRLTIYSQKQEIEIMRLVGASNWQIRGPFVVEGGYYGAFSALLTLIIMYPVIYAISDKLIKYIPEVDIFAYFLSNIIQIILLIGIVGIGMGMISSYIAVKRYLRI